MNSFFVRYSLGLLILSVCLTILVSLDYGSCRVLTNGFCEQRIGQFSLIVIVFDAERILYLTLLEQL